MDLTQIFDTRVQLMLIFVSIPVMGMAAITIEGVVLRLLGHPTGVWGAA